MDFAVEKTEVATKRPRGRPRQLAVETIVTPEVAQPSEPTQAPRYVVTHNAMAGFDGSGLHQFTAGDIIEDWWTINQLLKVNANFVSLMNENTKIVTCPHCRHKLPIL